MLERARAAGTEDAASTARAEAERLFAPEVVCEQISTALEELVFVSHARVTGLRRGPRAEIRHEAAPGRLTERPPPALMRLAISASDRRNRRIRSETTRRVLYLRIAIPWLTIIAVIAGACRTAAR